MTSVAIKPIYLDLASVCSIVTLSPATVQLMVRQKQFPKPRSLSAKRVGWLLREVEEWAEQRPVSELLPPENTGGRRKKRVVETVSAPQTALQVSPTLE